MEAPPVSVAADVGPTTAGLVDRRSGCGSSQNGVTTILAFALLLFRPIKRRYCDWDAALQKNYE
jgi:hypothetical protein